MNCVFGRVAIEQVFQEESFGDPWIDIVVEDPTLHGARRISVPWIHWAVTGIAADANVVETTRVLVAPL